jgi:hypothetical protein
MSLKKFGHNHLATKWAFFLFVKLFLIYKSYYVMLFLIFDIDHFLAVLAFTDVSAAVGFMKVNPIDWE